MKSKEKTLLKLKGKNYFSIYEFFIDFQFHNRQTYIQLHLQKKTNILVCVLNLCQNDHE